VAFRANVQPGSAVGWFSQSAPPDGLVIERDPDRVGSCRLVVGDDAWPTHLAAVLGLPTIMLLPATADWLWGASLGKSPWYPALELARNDDRATLAARLAS